MLWREYRDKGSLSLRSWYGFLIGALAEGGVNSISILAVLVSVSKLRSESRLFNGNGRQEEGGLLLFIVAKVKLACSVSQGSVVTWFSAQSSAVRK
jgi:hypothetical protein